MEGFVRRLPYTPNEHGFTHYDFIRDPSLIPNVLEDFVPFKHQRGVQKYYRLLRFLNGPRSVFETTDCGIRPPRENRTPQHGKGAPLEIQGRLMVVFRDHKENLSDEAMHGLRIAFEDELSRVRPDWPMACIGTALYWSWFSTVSEEPCEEATGRELFLQYWVWGHSENECFDNFGTLMQGVGVALCRAQARFQYWVSRGRPSLLTG